MKIDDNQVEACGEEQRSMHEYAADVVNQLMLPIHSCTCNAQLKSRFICFCLIINSYFSMNPHHGFI